MDWRRAAVLALLHTLACVGFAFLIETLFLAAFLGATVTGGLAAYMLNKEETTRILASLRISFFLLLICIAFALGSGYVFQLVSGDPGAGLGFLGVMILVLVSTPGVFVGGGLGARFGS